MIDEETGNYIVAAHSNQRTRHTTAEGVEVDIWYDLVAPNVPCEIALARSGIANRMAQKDATVDRSIVKKNTAGIFYEISADALISNNLVLGNTRQGIYVAASSGVRVLNNTVYQNWAGIVLHGMPRADHPTFTNNTVRNNIIGESELGDLVLYSDPLITSGNTTDDNLYYHPDSTVKISLTRTKGYNVNYRNLPVPGNEQHSRAMNPLWESDFSLKSNSPAINAGQLVEEIGSKDLAGLMRVSDGVIDIGAYEFHRSSILAPENVRLLN